VGRMSVLTLYPFCTAETIGAAGDGLNRLFQTDFSGLESKGLSLSEAMDLATFPELVDQTAEERAIWFDGYITTILQRDVKMIAELEKISILPHMLRILASRAGSLINDSDIARETGLNSVTGKTYRNILK